MLEVPRRGSLSRNGPSQRFPVLAQTCSTSRHSEACCVLCYRTCKTAATKGMTGSGMVHGAAGLGLSKNKELQWSDI